MKGYEPVDWWMLVGLAVIIACFAGLVIGAILVGLS